MNKRIDQEQVFRIHFQIEKLIDANPKVGIVLGSGLENNLKNFMLKKQIDLKEIDEYPKSTVEGHSGKLLYGTLEGVETLIFLGRIHFYEGYSMDEVIIPMRIAELMGIKIMILTNSAGAINCQYEVGDFVLIEDHISLFVPNCLMGENDERFGIRFPDMTQVYDTELICRAEEIAKLENINIHKGVYVQLMGPSFETATEIRMLRNLGADLVGMSTVVESVCCRHMGIRVCGISCVSNMATGITNQKQSYQDVKDTAQAVADKLVVLLSRLVSSLKEEPDLNENQNL
ncbi:purine-nucleoside phosphorylase [Blautia liquoris]|uniref:Purine nucleoside phosphorylase n=1 Tax=Blautia liquoris TaxID=2779518 RepID=A0A7M2RFW0_9FIRM|nr:purine-nucleoside phosphorylase [Blautia liquoris]QOV19226.1 purine-nucleoside phosphorylase [Blautia liquoris]